MLRIELHVIHNWCSFSVILVTFEDGRLANATLVPGYNIVNVKLNSQEATTEMRDAIEILFRNKEVTSSLDLLINESPQIRRCRTL